MDARRSMLDVVRERLQNTCRNTFVHRLTYIGEHRLGRTGFEEFMKNLVSAQLEQYIDEHLTGFLLSFQNHFLHILSGSEWTLTKHLQSLIDPDIEAAPLIGTIRVLAEQTHINKRYFTTWTSRTATPPTLAQRLDPDAPPAEVMRLVSGALDKTWRLVDLLKRTPQGPQGSASAPLNSQATLLLPEPELLQFLLQSPYLMDVRELIRNHDRPPRLLLYDDVVWPAQTDYVPYNILESSDSVGGEAEEVPDEDEDEPEGEGVDADLELELRESPALESTAEDAAEDEKERESPEKELEPGASQ